MLPYSKTLLLKYYTSSIILILMYKICYFLMIVVYMCSTPECIPNFDPQKNTM